MIRALAIVLLLAVASAARAQVTLQKSSSGGAYTGGTLRYQIVLTRLGGERGLVIHDRTPTGHTLLAISSAGATLDCATQASGSLGADYPSVSCDIGGELQISVRDGPSNPAALDVTYRAPSTPGTSNNHVSATCNPACTALPGNASAEVSSPTLRMEKSAPATAPPGGSLRWVVKATNTGPYPLDGFTVDDALPPGTQLVDVVVGGATFTAAELGARQTAPDGAQLMLEGMSLHLQGPRLPSQTSYTLVIDATVAGDATAGSAITNTAKGTPQGGATATATATTQVSSQPNSLTLKKSVSPAAAKIGDTVHYTLVLTPSGAQPGPIVLTDPIDAALVVGALQVNGQPTSCGATAGPLSISCGSDGRTVTVALPAGQSLTTPLTVDIAATVRPNAGATIDNLATVTDAAGAAQSDARSIRVTNASPTGASVLVSAAKALATKGDLVPFSVEVGTQLGSQTLASPLLTLAPSRGLRVVAADIRVRAPDGSVVTPAPAESGASLSFPLPPLLPGVSATVVVRARINGRAAVGGRETLRASLTQAGAALAEGAAEVRVDAEPELDLGTIVGEVFRDDDGDGTRDRGEPPVAGALVVMDDGLQAVTDVDGRYHLAANRPGDRAIKLATHTLPPGATLTTDVIRVVPITPGALSKIDFGVRVPAPEAPLLRPELVTAPPALAAAGNGRVRYRLAGHVPFGTRVLIDGKLAAVDRAGTFTVDLVLAPGLNRFVEVTEWPDGRVVVAARDVYFLARAEGGDLIVPRDAEPRLTLRFPRAALPEPTFRLEGVATAPLLMLRVAGQTLVPDQHGNVALALRLPESGAGVAVDARFADGLSARFSHTLSAGGDFAVLVGLADGKVGYVQKSDASGSHNGFFAQGRVKLYAKGRIQGRWLIEGGIDLDSAQIDTWRDLFRGDPQRIFRNLDPDRFYTVYGDASQTVQAAQSRARLYVRVALDRSELLFGNFSTGLTGVELGRYSRAVTGGRISFVRAAEAEGAPPSTQVILFGAWLQTARAHDELRGSGGSLYYLSHRTVVEGSEQVRIELRDKISDRPTANTAQRATVDYEIDYLAGRLIMRDPVASVAPSPTLVRSGNLDGDRAFLVVDYEYIIAGDSDDGTLGARATQAIGPVRLGGTIVNELRSIGNYTLLGGDIHIDMKRYGAIIGEYAHSYGALTSFSRSDDGGLTYADALATQAAPGQRQGNAYKAEADLHLKGISFRPYFRGIDQGYTDTAHAQDAGFMQWGGEGEARLFGVTVRVHYDERRYQQAVVYDAAGAPIESLSETRRDLGGEVGRTFGRVGLRLGARSERVDDVDPSRAGHRTALGARVDVRVVRALTLYTAGQYALEKGGGDPSTSLVARDNSLGAVGAVATLPWQTKATGEASYGAQGAGGLMSLRSELSPGRVLYGTFTLAQDHDDRVSTAVAAGGRERIADARGNARATLFAEDQFRDGALYGSSVRDASRAHMQTAGIDVPVGQRFTFGTTFERGEVTPSGTPMSGSAPLNRTAGTAYASYAGQQLRLQAKGELRRDTIAQASGDSADETAWLVQGMLTWRAHRDLSVRAKVFFSNSTAGVNLSIARSSEATVGFAWRPSWTSRLALLGRYTYLDEGLPRAQGQSSPGGGALVGRERAHVLGLAGEGRVVWRFSLGEKIAAKRREEVSPGGPAPQAGDTSAWLILWINRVTFHMTRAWDALAEYRLLYGPGPARTHGVAIEVNRILVGHLRLGAGWNFSTVSDDETRLGDGTEKGFFIRAQGFY